ncbi:MAG: DUF1385 domain-containing protein [Chloroflexi bacterium]|nr:DUF1385 domain-containing protein [Chloroflexota bacterium]
MNQKAMYGGQAVIEGVMMRGKKFVACAVRKADGEIVMTSERLSAAIYSSGWAKIPFLRAVTIMWDTIVLGTRMLMWAANIAVAEEVAKENAKGAKADAKSAKADAKSAKENAKERESAKGAKEFEGIPAGAAWGTLAVSLTFGIGLFFVLPLVAVNFADPFLNAALPNDASASVASNLLEGAIRLVIFLIYIGSISMVPDIRRVFQYHGAEHKTIAAEEAGAELTPATIQKFSKEHPRCGTGFLLTVVVVSIFVFALFGRPPLEWRIASRILLVPVVAALSYELIKFGSAHQRNPILYWLVVKPSLALQSLTTREPEDEMVLVAVAALRKVQAEEASA